MSYAYTNNMKVFKKLLFTSLKGIFGLGVIYYLNQYLLQYGIAPGVNVYNGAIIGVLGIPGFVLLYVLVILDQWVF